MKPTRKQTKLANALGADRVQTIRTKNAQGPLGLLALRHEIAGRLHSSGGRPSDPSWTLRRGVHFSERTWTRLSIVATQMSGQNRKITPAQVAATLIERELDRELSDNSS